VAESMRGIISWFWYNELRELPSPKAGPEVRYTFLTLFIAYLFLLIRVLVLLQYCCLIGSELLKKYTTKSIAMNLVQFVFLFRRYNGIILVMFIH